MQLRRILKTQSKQDVLLQTALLTLVSVLLSILITFIIIRLFNSTSIIWELIATATIVPLIVAPPVSFFVFNLVLKKETLNEKLRIANENLKHLSQYDALTGLYNRGYFWILAKEVLTNSLKNKTNVTVILLDVDNFKNVNDTYGHLVGDKVLQHIAKTIKTCIRQDDILGRYGGEEFAIIFNNCNRESAKERAEAICKVVRTTTFKTDEIELPISVSIGVATNQENNDFEVIINLADAAMYRAKHQGKDQVCFSYETPNSLVKNHQDASYNITKMAN